MNHVFLGLQRLSSKAIAIIPYMQVKYSFLRTYELCFPARCILVPSTLTVPDCWLVQTHLLCLPGLPVPLPRAAQHSTASSLQPAFLRGGCCGGPCCSVCPSKRGVGFCPEEGEAGFLKETWFP